MPSEPTRLTLIEFVEWIKSHTITEHSDQSVFVSDDATGDGSWLLADDGSKVTIELGYEGGCESDPWGGDYTLRFFHESRPQ